MFSNRFRMNLVPSLLTVGFLFLASCQGSDQETGGRVAAEKQGDQAAESLTETDANLKAIQKDALSLLPSLQLAVPAFNNLGKDTGTTWDKYLKVKNWYVGSQQNADNMTDLISLTTVEDSSEYIAFQSQYKVFINSLLLDKLSVSKKSRVLLEEYLTSLYTLKYLDDQQLCDLMKFLYQDKVTECAKHLDTARASLREASPGAAPTEIASEISSESSIVADNSGESIDAGKKSEGSDKSTKVSDKILKDHSIRSDEKEFIKSAANYLASLRSSDAVSTVDVVTKLQSFNFDVRIFDYKLGVSALSASPTTITKDQYNSLILSLKEAGKSDMSCMAADGSTSKCQVAIKNSDKNSDRNSETFSLTVKFADTMLTQNVVLKEATAEVPVSRYVDATTGSKNVYFVLPSVKTAADQLKEGAYYRGALVMAQENEGDIKFLGILSLPGVVKKIKFKENSEEKNCEVASAQDSQRKEASAAAVFAGISDAKIDVKFLKLVPNSPCAAGSSSK